MDQFNGAIPKVPLGYRQIADPLHFDLPVDTTPVERTILMGAPAMDTVFYVRGADSANIKVDCDKIFDVCEIKVEIEDPEYFPEEFNNRGANNVRILSDEDEEGAGNMLVKSEPYDEDDEEDEIKMDKDDSEYIPEGYNNRGATSNVRIISDEDDEDYVETRGRRGRKKLTKNEIISDQPEKWVEKIENDYTCLLCHEPVPQETTTITISQYNHDPDSVETEPQTLEHKKCIYDMNSIVTHMKNEHDLRLYVCNVCGENFQKLAQLSHHLDEHANEVGDFQCEVCNRIFTNSRLFRIHKRSHSLPKKWICEICGKQYSSRNILEEHFNTHTGIRPYKCQTCGKCYASKYTFSAHAKTHQTRPRPHSCSSCGKTFLSVQNLAQHERTHSTVRNFVCDQCGKAFATARNLDIHSITHSGYKPFVCSTCGKTFARKAEIRDHERTHTGEKPYQCEFCGSTFSQQSNLQSHKRATHYQDKRYKCDDCGKAFKRRRLLDYHTMAVHTGERPHKCTLCPSTFVYPEHFKKHKLIHTGEKPFRCEICDKAFNSRDNRNAHQFIHSDKKRYECLVCGMGFMRKPLLNKHIEKESHFTDILLEEDIVIE